MYIIQSIRDKEQISEVNIHKIWKLYKYVSDLVYIRIRVVLLVIYIIHIRCIKHIASKLENVSGTVMFNDT